MDTENNGTEKTNYHANMEAAEKIPSHKRLVTNIGAFRGSKEKFEVYFLVPVSDQECQVRYDCKLEYLIEAGVRQLATRVDYPSVGFDFETDTTDKIIAETGELKDGGHEAMQELADGYKVGAKRVAGTTQKKKAAELDAVRKGAEEVDMDDAEALRAYVERIKASGGSV